MHGRRETRTRAWWVGIGLGVLALALVACDGDGGGGGAADTGPPGPTDTVVSDATADVTPPQDTPAPADVPVGPYGFPIRLPGTHEYVCPTVEGPQSEPFTDRDWVCSFAHGGTEGLVYVQATPTECVSMGMGYGAVYDIAGAWISVGDVVTPLTGSYYDWGGNHQNDYLDFTYDGADYRYTHSSFGWGWHACQAMDCLQVLDAADQVTEDGCCPDRALPVVCVEVTPEGTVPALEDTFAPCNGHENFSCLN
jgi:hypothetical protein